MKLAIAVFIIVGIATALLVIAAAIQEEDNYGE